MAGPGADPRPVGPAAPQPEHSRQPTVSASRRLYRRPDPPARIHCPPAALAHRARRRPLGNPASLQLQSEWGELVTVGAGQPTKIHFIVNDLSYSRRFRCAPQSDADDTYEGLIRTFEYFGGVPQLIIGCSVPFESDYCV